MSKSIGLDLWRSKESTDVIFALVIQNHIALFEFYVKDNYQYFYTEIYQRKTVQKVFSNIEYIRTSGMLGFLFQHCTNIRFSISCITIVCFWIVVQQITFAYQVKGEEGNVKEEIVQYLEQCNFPNYLPSLDFIKNELYVQFANRLSWLEVYQQGGLLTISFAEKKNVEIEELSREPLVAMKNAMIVSFDVQHGYKRVKEHDFVYEGTILVDSYMLDSTNEPKELFVKGKVYGYTWYTITSSCLKEDSLHEGIMFFRLLLDARQQISVYLDQNEKIVKETILQYRTDKGTILLQVHYTLLEDITVP